MKRAALIVAIVALLGLSAVAYCLPEACNICAADLAYCQAACAGPYRPGDGSYYECVEQCCWSQCI